MAIDKVTIQGVRGIKSKVELTLGGKSLMILGDNGTGKSSVEWALRWALTGEGEPTSDASFTTEESYRRNIAVDVDEPEVSVSFVDGSTLLVAPGTLTTGGSGAEIRSACRAARPMLRRAELLNVLSSKPSDRFSYFESFLGLEKVDGMIRELTNHRSALESRRTSLTSKLDTAFQPLLALLPPDRRNASTLSELLKASTDWARRLGVDPTVESLADIREQLSNRLSLVGSPEVETRRSALAAMRLRTQEIRERLQRLPVDLDAQISHHHSQRDGLLDAKDAELLAHALSHFQRVADDACPVCGQQIDSASVKESLEARIEALASYHEQLERLRVAAALVRGVTNRLVSLESELSLLNKALSRPIAYSVVTPTVIKSIDAVRDEATESMVAAISSVGVPVFINATIEMCDRFDAVLGKLDHDIPSVEDLPDLQTATALFEKLVRAETQLHLTATEAASLLVEVKTFDKILDAFRRSRQDVAKETLTAIQDLVGECYFYIHPRNHDDATGAPSIDVQRHGKGTAFVRGAFSGKVVKDPTWVYSDGHLDTVGICIFLALRRFRASHASDPKIMILDDIVLSIDLGHARRLLELLKASFGDHQIIILTHNGLFAHWCRSVLPGLVRIQIKGWRLDKGPQLGDFKTARDRLSQAILDGTAKEIALSLMEFLDEWVIEARYEYSVAVPAKPGEQYTLRDIWEPLSKVLRTLCKQLAPQCDDILALLDETKAVPDIRNALAAHENDFAKEYPRAAIADVAIKACELVDALYCAECVGFVAPIPNRFNPSMMHCRGHHIQYVRSAG